MTKFKAYTTLARKKTFGDSASELAKVLSTLDLIALGVGSTLGVGIYVLAGEVSKTTAGPAVVLSFAIAAVASVMAGLCYAEFGSRVPKAGSAYIYSYVTIGEFIAFIIGWNLILEYSIGAASVAKALSTYFDALFNKAMAEFFREHIPMNVDGLSPFVDFFSLGVTLVFAVALALGAKESTIINNIFTLCNLAVVVYVIVTGFFLVDASNWTIPAEEVPEGYGDGGFAPYGFAGIIKGAAICFYGFIGFDVIATAGEETKNPKRSIPISVIVSLFIIFSAYFTLATVLTMILPYYEQDESAPLVYVFRYFKWVIAEYIVSVGAIFGLCASLMGSMFPLPRVVYAMASDGLIFKFLGRIHPRFKTPLYGTLVAGVLTGTISAVFNLAQLVNMMSIGTLLAYSMVAACVMLLRYELIESSASLDDDELLARKSGFFGVLFNVKNIKSPTKQTAQLITICVTLYCVWCALFSSVINLMEAQVMSGEWYAILLLVISVILIATTLYSISRQPRSVLEPNFTAPFNPWMPGISIMVNIYLMFQLDGETWMRFSIWIAVGLAIYFAYGMWNSHERPVNKQKMLALNAEQTNVIADLTTSKEGLVLAEEKDS